jgi:Mitochondrial resolvase Ydc2 / RNA splicing MRS1
METLRRNILSFDIGIKNLAYCLMTYNMSRVEIVQWNVVSLVEKSQKIPSMDVLATLLFPCLDEIVSSFQDIGVDIIHHVLIENQPSRLNGTMKTIQCMIYSYFQLRRCWEGIVEHVSLISAKQKLIGHDAIVETIELPLSIEKGTYKYNKWMSCQIVERMVQQDDVLCPFFKTFKKKDDLSDTLLQGLSWIYKNYKTSNAHVMIAVKNNISK